MDKSNEITIAILDSQLTVTGFISDDVVGNFYGYLYNVEGDVYCFDDPRGYFDNVEMAALGWPDTMFYKDTETGIIWGTDSESGKNCLLLFSLKNFVIHIYLRFAC